MLYYPAILITSVILLTAGCQGRGDSLNIEIEVDTINLEYSELPSVPIDSVVTNVRFVPLETNSDWLIESYDEIQVVGGKIFVRSSGRVQQALFVFDIDGNHLLTIDAEGRGPGEYLALRGFFVNHDKREIGLLDLTKVLIYDYTGNHLRSHSFQMLGLMPCDFIPSLIRHSHNFFMLVSTYETHGAEPERGWGVELMEEDMFNLVAVYDSEWKLASRSYPIPRERSGQFYRHQLTAGGQEQAFFSDGERLWFHSVFSDYLYEVVDNKFIPRYLLDYGRHKIPEIEHKEAVKIHAWQGADYLFTFMNSNYGFPGARFTARGSIILFQPQIGKLEPLILYDMQNQQSIVIGMDQTVAIGNMTNLYPTRGIKSYEGGYFGHLSLDRLVFAKNWASTVGKEHCTVSPLSPLNFPKYDSLSREDNAVLLFFDFKTSILKSRE